MRINGDYILIIVIGMIASLGTLLLMSVVFF